MRYVFVLQDYINFMTSQNLDQKMFKMRWKCFAYLSDSAGFTCRLYRLKPRASRSKGASENCGTHRVNGRYIIIQIKLRQKFYVLFIIHEIQFYSTFVVVTPSLPTSFHESQYDGWSSCMPTIVSICSKHVGCVLRLLNRIDCYVWLYQKKL